MEMHIAAGAYCSRGSAAALEAALRLFQSARIFWLRRLVDQRSGILGPDDRDEGPCPGQPNPK
jgi:hypothetical protein